MRTIVILLAIATLGAAQFLTLKQLVGIHRTATILPPWQLVGRGIGTLTIASERPYRRITVIGTIAGLNPNRRHGIWSYNSTNCGYVGSINVDTGDDHFTTDDKGVLYLDFNTSGRGLFRFTDGFNHPIVIHEIELKNRFDYTCGIMSKIDDEVSCCTEPILKTKARLVPWFTCCGSYLSEIRYKKGSYNIFAS